MSDALATVVTRAEDRLRSKRANWESLWQQVSRFVLPKEATFIETITPGHERTRNLFDSTAPRSLELFASFLHHTMNNPAQQWFTIGPEDERKVGVSTQQYLDAVATRTLSRMVRAKIYDQLHQAFLFLGAFGTACIYVEYLPSVGLRIRHFHIRDVVAEEGESGEFDTAFRRFPLTPRQAMQRWGDRAGLEAKDLKDEDPVRFIHAVTPMNNPEFADHMPRELRAIGNFASVVVNAKNNRVVSMGHFDDFPYLIPRWYTTADEKYGRSPAMAVMPAIRMANRMKETIIRGSEKLVDPPLLIPDGGMISPVRMFPGGLNYTDGTVKVDTLIPPGASRIEMGFQLLAQVQNEIERGFFVPLFIDIDEKVKTATQVLSEADERNRAVSPMITRVQSELYDRLIPLVVNNLQANGQLPDPPEDVDGDFKVRYVSPLTASRRQSEGLSLLRLFEGLAPWASVDPELMDRFDGDEIALILHAANGVPAKILRTDPKLKALRKSRREAQQQQEALQQLDVGAGAAADLMKAGAAA